MSVPSEFLAVLKAFNRRRKERRNLKNGRLHSVSAIPAGHDPVSLQMMEVARLLAEGAGQVVLDEIDFSTGSEAPVVSILIASFGKVDYTARCLWSIWKFPPSVPYEVILLEDASGDPAVIVFHQVKGLRFIENEINLGYLRSSNEMAFLARGRFLHILNNDTQVMPGAIDALHARCAENDSLMVGSRLIYPDGTLQEAGGIVWRDGSACNHGRGQSPWKAEFSYPREVDYCSGASVMLSKALWQQLGGYDERYIPAYYEDTDLAFSLRAIGGTVAYEPLSIVVHHEGVSHGTSASQGLKAYQAANALKFREKWARELQENHFPPGEGYVKAKEKAARTKLVLVLDRHVPEIDRDAGSRSIMSLMEAYLSRGCTVKFWPLSECAQPHHVHRLQAAGIEVLSPAEQGSLRKWLKKNGKFLDAVLLSRPEVAKALLAFVKAGTAAPVVYYGHDLHFARLHMQAEVSPLAGIRAQARDMMKLEKWIWRQVDKVLYPSREEVDLVKNLMPSADVHRINAFHLRPDRFRVRRSRESTRQLTLIFVSGFQHAPNEDAATWFVKEIFPFVQKRHPSCRLKLVGAGPTRQVKDLASADVEVTGQVSEELLKKHYEQADLAVVPLRFGAGVKLKVLEAMALGVPLVTTDVGLQGLADADFAHGFNTPASFAARIGELLEDPQMATHLIECQYEYIERNYSLEGLAEGLMNKTGLSISKPAMGL